MKMDGCVRSGGVLKKKSSSGCLIIKKKDDSKNSGAPGGFSSGNEKKRPRLAVSYSGSSDEYESLEFMRRKVIDKRISNGPMGYGGIEVSGEKKNNPLDLFDFDEYDEFDGEKMRNDQYSENRFKMVDHSGGGNSKKFGVGPSNRNVVVDKQKHVQYFDGSSRRSSKGLVGDLRDQGLQLGDDETHMPISFLKLKYQETTKEPVRFQGKNGVLKVMVNKKKKLDLPSHHKSYDHRAVEERKGYKSENAVKKDSLARKPLYPDSKLPENRGLFEKNRSFKDKKEAKFERAKPSLTEGSKARDLVIDGTDTTLKLAPPGSQASSSKKGVKREEERFSSPVKVTPVKGKEAKGEKSKRGGSTEKQMLREKIRKMLVDAGWTIDYRPRRNRDYLDAVYINPSGTAYWSIIKAYDAFRKNLEEDGDKSKVEIGSPSFAPLSEDLLNKLTRQTKKRIKEEMKRKRKVDQESGDDTSDESLKRKPRKVRKKSSFIFNSNVVQGRTSKIIGRCTLLARGSDKGGSSYSDGYVPYNGKRTVLSWLIDSGAAKLSEKVQYMNRKRNRVMLEGWITKDGIHCGCCSKILTVSKFELHAGSKLRQPFQNIFLESGVSLLQCQIDAWNRQEDSVRRDFYSIDVDGGDPDDDTCGICGDGGDLICCDSCPSTFHQICLEIQMLPSGDWHCPNCTCKYCGDTRGNVTPDSDGATDEPIKCSFCEKKYHRSCSEKVCAAPLSSNNASICGPNCQELYDHIQKILGVKHELEAGFSWSLIQRMDVSDASHRNFPQRVECNSKLAVTLSVMNECFLPIFDRRSGINMIHNVVYNCGSNFNRLNYRGFYTAILERGDELISAASIRIHGTCLAEMPFIGTRETYRRQGMCRRLLTAIETALVFLGVEKLIIPAISEHMDTWMTVFSFHQLEDALKKEIKSMNMLVFPGTDMLQKQLIKQEISEGMTVSELNKNQLQQPVLLENPLADSSLEDSERVENDTEACHETRVDENVGALDSDSPASAFPCSDPASAGTSDTLCEPDNQLSCKGTTVTGSVISKEHIESSSGLKCDISYPENPSTAMDNAKSSIHDTLDESLNTAEANGNHNPINSSGEEVAKVEDSVDSSVKISEDSTPETIVTDCCFKYLPALALEPSVKNTTVIINGVSNPASCPTTIVNDDPSVHSDPYLDQPTLPIMKSSPNSFVEASTDALAATDAKIDVTRGIVDSSTVTDTSDDKMNDLSPSCTKENVKVSGVQIPSVEEINENQNPTPNSAFLDSEESTVKNDMVSGIAQEGAATCSNTDKSNGEIEIPHVVNVGVSCPITSHEHLAQNTATSENLPESSGISDSYLLEL